MTVKQVVDLVLSSFILTISLVGICAAIIALCMLLTKYLDTFFAGVI